MKTASIEMAQHSLNPYLREIDKAGFGYHFVATVTDAGPGTVKLELSIDGSFQNGTTVVLRPDGTWFVLTELPVEE